MQDNQEFLLPGDLITDRIRSQYEQLISKDIKPDTEMIAKLGKGLFANANGDCFAVRPGHLQYYNQSKQQKHTINWSIVTHGRVYFPSVQDVVIGIIKKRHFECYLVDINTPTLAYLSLLDFEGATKRNKPELEVGDSVYARVVLFQRDLEPILSCVGSQSSKGVSILGPLKPKSHGVIFECTSLLCLHLSKQKCQILDALGKIFRFDILVGLNRRVFVETFRAIDCAELIRCIISCDRTDLLNSEKHLSNHLEAIIRDHTMIG